ncbi:MAG: YihY/virulence factor BrkB family protein [Hymenobacteraceae bacterium]|nr:YihY/virulence factor BrkB family protein [Hymenobacteraceae bacterium]MDX5394992.1 YihY/virulence factor BrkB family protein [Hymenobacteraceae bacterium]MDX5442681.1 YihY/virulence factor BrkB family protein [Hymenobacteraceae bacterium]MDX5511025.1 YihY/virulence factor BrkB family protein [Hymenobacteraceae bacterium]
MQTFLQEVKKHSFNAWCLIKETVLEFIDMNTFQKGAALAYYTVFALPPILIIIINFAGLVFGRKAVSGEIYFQVKELIGSKGAYDVQMMVENIHQEAEFTLSTIIGIVTLLIGATGVFISMQDSLNQIWGVKPKPRREYLKLLLDRVLSFAMILSITFLLLVSLVINAMLVAISDFLVRQFTSYILHLIHLLSFLVSLAFISFLFAAIYKFLPDAKIRWRDVGVGALVTAILFSLGRAVIGFYLGSSNMASVYGATGSVIIILVWAFYSSQILFFGAIFTLVYSRKYGENIFPTDYAVRVVRQEIEVGKQRVNEPGKHQHEVWDAETGEQVNKE